jgi:RNA polymerase subunit RPABC4/transcription elongation factor Spt4
MIMWGQGILSRDIQVCTKCGIIFDIEYRRNKDCPLCHSGEYVNLRQDNE